MDELKRLRQRSGISEQFDTNYAMSAAAGLSQSRPDPSMPAQGSGVMQALMQLAQSGDQLADAMLETLKVAHNMTPKEAVERVAQTYLRGKGVGR